MVHIPQPVRNAAQRLASLPGRWVPYAAQKPVLHVALNQAFRVPLEDGELEFLEGSRVRILITDLAVDWLIEVMKEGFVPVDREQASDVTISGELLDFALLATRRMDHDQLFFQRRIHLEGNTELGLGLKNTMDGMDWDDLPLPLRLFLKGLGEVIGKLPLDAGQSPAP